MSTGQWIGAVLGAIVGFLIGGWYGAVYGAIIGYTIGGYIDPVKPDVKQPGAPAPLGLQVMTNVIGNPIFDVLGTAKITGQLLFFGGEFNRAVWYRPSKGVRAISGYKYYASWALGICMGEVDCLYTVFRDQDPIWEGELTRPASGGEATIQITGMGTMVFYFGTDDQVANTNAGTLLPDPTLNTGHRHLCWAFFDACFMNEYNRMPSMTFVVRKTPSLFSEATSRIAIYDTNPAHAIWHALINKAGLPEDWVDSVDFLAVATTLYNEGRGISILFDVHQPVLSYIEAINSHVDNVLRYGSDGKFHPKLIRYDYVPADLPVVDESILLEEPTFSRRSWIDTINEVKVQYSEIKREFSLTVTKSGGGTGTVTSDPAGINCGSDCVEFYAGGVTVVLTATPDAGIGNSFIGWSGDGTGDITRVVVMDGNKVVNAKFDDPYLIAWYKFDEGSGLIVNNYATDGSLGGGLFPDLTVVNLTDKFWDYLPGFGSSPDPPISADSYAFFDNVSSWGSYGGVAGACYGGFFKLVLQPLAYLRNFLTMKDVSGFNKTYQYIFPNFASQANFSYEMEWLPEPFLATPYPAFIVGQWVFGFYADDGRLHVVRSNGTKLQSVLIQLYTGVFDVRMIFVGVRDASGFGTLTGSYGDVIFYNNIRLTVAEWAAWYDKLRSRYGMAARSGW